jgi:RNA polymerase sigma factor (sigma-70 family)
MSKAALGQILDQLMGPRECDPDSHFLSRFLTERDEDAFAALVHRHGPLVYGTCLRILGNRDDADDAFQAVFFVLARRAHTLKRGRSIGPWLYGVALRVAKKLRGQLIQRRLREMAAANSEGVEAAEPNHDFWAIIDEELARLSQPLRTAVLSCDLSGQSHAQAAKSLGLAKGTITKRLAKAHEELASRLRHRGVTLGVGALATMFATQAPASVPAPLLLETAKQAVAFSSGQVVGSLAAKILAEGVMRSLKLGVVKVWVVVGLLALALTGGGLMLAGGPADADEKKVEQAQPKADAKPQAAKLGTMWKECFTGEYQSSLPVSVALGADGKTLLTGDTNGEVMALTLPSDPPTYRWKSNADGSHAAVAYSTDQKKIYATAKDGVRILDSATGKEEARIDAKDSNPIAIGVFPKKIVADNFTQLQILFGDARGYFIKTWAEGSNIAETVGTIETRTVAQNAQPADAAAIPLAVDPKGRSAIMTGPHDATGQLTGMKGKNVLWAYVCGDYSEGSPGNRVMVGHTATVIAAAWAKEGRTAVTGDADGRVIVWDAKTMKESRRIELGGRVLALAMSDDGTHTAACVRGKQGGEFYVWETSKQASALKPIHTQQADFGFQPYASVAFSPDGKRLAGCAIDKKWRQLYPPPLLHGQVHVWERAAEPQAQPAPRRLYTKTIPKGSSPNFVVLDNFTLLTIAAKEGAIDFRNIKEGHIQSRLVLGKFTIGGIKLSSDRKWLAVEQHPPENNPGLGLPVMTFDVGVYAWPPIHKATIPSCRQLLDIASGGKFVAVVREQKIEVWDIATSKHLKSAPFKHIRIDAASFSPDAKLLAISDRNELVLWRWEEDKHERIDLGRCVGSLAFSPDGKYLAEGPTPRENIQIRDLETRKVVQTLANSTKLSMNVPRLAYTQGGRVLIACDNITLVKEITVPHRIHFWDAATGTVAHQIALPAGLPYGIDVSPNGRYLAAMFDEGDSGIKLSVWRLDGQMPVAEEGTTPPAATLPR